MEVRPFDAPLRGRAMADVNALSEEALRTLAVAYRPLRPQEDPGAAETLERDLIFVGTVGIIDPPREEVGEAIREARRAGVRVIMITGDHPRTAVRIASDVGIVEPGAAALTGTDLDRLDDAGSARRGAGHLGLRARRAGAQAAHRRRAAGRRATSSP
jgi:magnesium-transporting ATPase (P-type)